MSLPSSGSTAPTITSPLLAWPSLPKSRSPLSTPPTSASFQSASIPSIYSRPDLSVSRSLASSLSASDSNLQGVDKKGKGKAVEERSEEDGKVERHYGPPKQPLSPHQLSRIAQSFGIIVPSLPPPSPNNASPLAGPSRLRHDPPIRASPYLLTVIPPLSLLSLQSTSGEEANKRTRKWKRGRLIPVQPTLAGMLVAIAREFGLPNTTGLQVYMGASHNMSSASSSASFSSDDPAGPHISAQSWPALFGSHLSATPSRSTTPTHTPVKPSGPLGREIPFPLSPLSLVEKKLETARSAGRDQRLKSFASVQPLTAPSLRSFSSDSHAPLTAGPNPIIGTIEFDLDPDLATWYPEYRRSGRQRKPSTASENGMRPLRLPRHLSAASPSFTRGAGAARSHIMRDSDGFGSFDSSEDATLNDHEEGLRDSTKSFLAIKSRDTEGRKLSVRRQGSSRALMSTAGSFGEMTEADVSFDTGSSGRDSGEESRMDIPAITLHPREHSGGPEEDLLASPIALGIDETLVPVLIARDGDPKRGSAMVMSDQLDDLERIMRQLSPRDIRLTSPRMLTPRMAQKVATSKLQFPVDNAPRRAHSNLAPAPIIPSASSLSVNIPGAATSTTSVNTFATQSSVPSFDATTLSRPPLEAEYSDAGLPIPSWPAVPFAKLVESPGSPSSIHEFFRTQSHTNAPDSPISAETLMRMKMPSPPEGPADKAPRRPNRPPSPEFQDSSIPSHSLPSEYLDQLQRSPLGTSATLSPGNGPIRTKSRSGSISLKGLKMGSRNFGWKRSEHEKQPPPALPLGSRRDEGEDLSPAIGLFGTGDKLSPKISSFPSVGRSTSMSGSTSNSDFGPTPIPDQTASTLPVKGNKDHSFSRWMNPFGSKKSHGSSAESPTAPETPKSKDRSSKSSKRHPSMDHRPIGSPVSGTLKRHAQPGNQHQHSPSFSSVNSHSRPGLPGLSSSTTTHTTSSEPMEDDFSTGHGQSPRMISPRSVKRKPVPPPIGQMPVRGSEDHERGMKSSMSMGSVASFGVEEKRGAVGLGVRAG